MQPNNPRMVQLNCQIVLLSKLFKCLLKEGTSIQMQRRSFYFWMSLSLYRTICYKTWRCQTSDHWEKRLFFPTNQHTPEQTNSESFLPIVLRSLYQLASLTSEHWRSFVSFRFFPIMLSRISLQCLFSQVTLETTKLHCRPLFDYPAFRSIKQALM